MRQPDRRIAGGLAFARQRDALGDLAAADEPVVMATLLGQIGARLMVMRRAGKASPEAISAERSRSRASETALSGRPTMAKAGMPGATCTCTSTATRWTILALTPSPLSQVHSAQSLTPENRADGPAQP